MKRLRHPIFTLGLVACFLFVGAVLTSLGVAHALHHAHHNAPTHSSIVCSWMCAAGQAAEVAEPVLHAPIAKIGIVESLPSRLLDKSFSLLVFSRGPPLL